MQLPSPIKALALAGALAFAPPFLAADLPSPAGDVVLTVSGGIAVTNAGDVARFDRDMLAALGEVTFTTTTIWTDGPQTFTGVPLAALLAAVGAEGGAVRLAAVNDYAVEFPRAELDAGAPIIAYLQNGAPMSLRDKGPLWIVYPFDDRPEYRSEVTYGRSVWQLDRIDVID